MRKLFASMILALLLVSGLSIPAVAQIPTNLTTLAAGVTGQPNAANTITVVTATSTAQASAPTGTAYVAGNYINIDDEVMQIRSNYVSGTSIPVIRGVLGTRVTPHTSGSPVYAGPPPAFVQQFKAGTCTAANETYLPQVAVFSPQSNVVLLFCNNGYWTQQDLSNFDAVLPYRAIGAGTTVGNAGDVLVVYTGQGTPTYTLPGATSVGNGKRIIVMNGTTGTTTITVNTTCAGCVIGNFAGATSSTTLATGVGLGILRLIVANSVWMTW